MASIYQGLYLIGPAAIASQSVFGAIGIGNALLAYGFLGPFPILLIQIGPKTLWFR